MPKDSPNSLRTSGSSISPSMPSSQTIGYSMETFVSTLRHAYVRAWNHDSLEWPLYAVAQLITTFHCSTAMLPDDIGYYTNPQPGIGPLAKGDTPDLAAVLGTVSECTYVYFWEAKCLAARLWSTELGVETALSQISDDYEQLNRYAVTFFEVRESPPKQLTIFHAVGPYFSSLIFEKSQFDELRIRDFLQEDLEEFPELLQLFGSNGRPATPNMPQDLLKELRTFHRNWCTLMTPVILFGAEHMFEEGGSDWRLSGHLRAALYKASVANQPLTFSTSWFSPDDGDLEAYTSIPSRKEQAMDEIYEVQEAVMDKCREEIRHIKHRWEIARREPLPSNNDSPETRRMFKRQAALDEQDVSFVNLNAESDTESDLDKGKRRPKHKLKRRRGN